MIPPFGFPLFSDPIGLSDFRLPQRQTAVDLVYCTGLKPFSKNWGWMGRYSYIGLKPFRDDDIENAVLLTSLDSCLSLQIHFANDCLVHGTQAFR